MTREERIDWLCRLRADLNNGIIFTPWNKEFTEALTGILEQEPSGDAISRQAVLDAMCEASIPIIYKGKPSFVVDYLRVFETLPSVKPQEPTGHWKRISMDKYSEHAKYWYRCDRCGKDNLGNTDWCPSCGARMIEPQERSE